MAKDLLIELGTEELPPKALKALIASFQQSLKQKCDAVNLGFEAIEAFVHG